MNPKNDKYLQQVADELNLPFLVVRNAYFLYWKFIKDTIKEIPSNITKEEFYKKTTAFKVIKIGTFYLNWYILDSNNRKRKARQERIEKYRKLKEENEQRNKED
ncbi:MAG: hypothetical protein LBM05_00605 [Endomicrobium sp.]|jgi:hypothetical protein|nr:hypothetical protein [Endomicrobium sp.]